MIKDITLGQYVPGETVIHKMDPRTKILIMLAYIVITFCIKSFWGYLLTACFVFGCIALSKIPPMFVFKGLKSIMLFILFTGVFNLFLTSGDVVWQWGILSITKQGIHLAVFMILRLVFLIMGTSLLTLTTSPISLTDGMEKLLSPFAKIGFPAHEFSMMMSIALRFIPTLTEETDKIMKAQAARGADFESGSLIQRAKAMIPILVPLFISSFRRADELASAMECRCYGVSAERTSLHCLKFHARDVYAAIAVVVLAVAVILINMFF